MSDRELLEKAAKAAGMAVALEEGCWFWCQHGPNGESMYLAGARHA
jgi:hypothetical protein